MVSMKITSALAAFLLATPMMVAATPFPKIPRDLPAGAARLALDEGSGKLIAYDASGKEIGQVDPAAGAPKKSKRDASACSNLSADDAQKLPGWKTLEDTAKKNWGDGKWNIVTNDKDFADQPAQVCTDSDSMTVEKNEDASCSDSKQKTEGSIVGSNGTATLTFTKGSTYTSKNTVTKEASIATGVTVSTKFSIPQVFEMGAEVSQTTTFTNSLSKEETVTASNIQTSSVTQNAPEGKKCRLEFNNKSCTLEGKGKVRMTATGWVWFQYEDKTHDHYKWALNIDEVLKNVDDRSSYAEFKAAISSETTSDYKGVCE